MPSRSRSNVDEILVSGRRESSRRRGVRSQKEKSNRRSTKSISKSSKHARLSAAPAEKGRLRSPPPKRHEKAKVKHHRRHRKSRSLKNTAVQSPLRTARSSGSRLKTASPMMTARNPSDKTSNRTVKRDAQGRLRDARGRFVREDSA